MYRNITKILMITLFVISNLASFNTVSAEDNKNKTFGGFSIEGIKKENQIDKNSGYFYLKENPDSKDKINIKLMNSSNQDKTLDIKIVNANTNSNGIIDYSGKLKDDSSLRIPLTSLVKTTKNQIVVPKNSTAEATLNIDMPATPINGVVVGGVVVSEKKKIKNLIKIL